MIYGYGLMVVCIKSYVQRHARFQSVFTEQNDSKDQKVPRYGKWSVYILSVIIIKCHSFIISRNRYCLVLANIRLKFMISLSSRNKILMLYYLNVFVIITKFWIFFFLTSGFKHGSYLHFWFRNTTFPWFPSGIQWHIVSKPAISYSTRFINCDVQCCTGRERLIRSHSSARFCFELSGNSN